MSSTRMCSWSSKYGGGESVYDVEGERKGRGVPGPERFPEVSLVPKAVFCVPGDWGVERLMRYQGTSASEGVTGNERMG